MPFIEKGKWISSPILRIGFLKVLAKTTMQQQMEEVDPTMSAGYQKALECEFYIIMRYFFIILNAQLILSNDLVVLCLVAELLFIQ